MPIKLLFDASTSWSAADDALASQWPRALVVHSKCDLAQPAARPAGIATSALAGIGISELERAIAGRLVARPPQPGEAVPFTRRQVHALTEMDRALAEDQRDQAARLAVSLLHGRLPEC